MQIERNKRQFAFKDINNPTAIDLQKQIYF